MSKGLWISILFICSAIFIDLFSYKNVPAQVTEDRLSHYTNTSFNKYAGQFLNPSFLKLLSADSLSFTELSTLKKIEKSLNEDHISVMIKSPNRSLFWHNLDKNTSLCHDTLQSGEVSIILCMELFDEDQELLTDLYNKAGLKHLVSAQSNLKESNLDNQIVIEENNRFRSNFLNYLILFLFFSGFLTAILSLLRNNKYFGFILLLTLRLLLFVLDFNTRFSQTELSASLFNSTFYSSIDLFLDTSLILGLLISFSNYQFRGRRKSINYLYVFANFIFIALLFIFHIKLIQLLMYSDNLDITINNLSAISLVDLLVFISILILKAGIFIYVTSFVLNLKKHLKRRENYFGFFLCILAAAILSKIFIVDFNPLILSVFLIVYFLLLDLFIDIQNKTITWIIWWGIFFGGYLSALFFNFDIKKEITARKEFLQNSFYAYPQNEVELIKSSGIVKKISKELEKLLTLPEEAQYDMTDIISFLNEKFERNDLMIYVEDKEGKNIFKTRDVMPSLRSINEKEFFDELNNELWIKSEGNDNYKILCGFKLPKNKHVANFKFDFISDEQKDIINFGLTEFEKNKLINAEEDILYSGPNVYVKYEPRPGNYLLTKKAFNGIVKPIALFSFFFSAIVLLILLFGLLNSFINFLPEDWPFKVQNINSLNSKIQISLILVILLSFFIIAFITSSFLKSFINSKDEVFISEKLESIARDLKEKTSIAETETEVVAIAANYEDILESIHNSELSITLLNQNYPQGDYFPYAYFSKQRNPKAYTDHSKSNKMVNFLPLKFKDKTVGFNRVEYNPKVTQKISVFDFLGSIFNVYVFLFLIASVIAIFIAKSIGKPLALLNQKLSQVQLGKRNELIKWEKEDEIGVLINNYNNMVVQLEESAQILAKTERDSAWREMAKQVAHEIKNPLTPMKMYIQHLEKAIKQQPENAVEISKKISATLLEQIENLTEIANSFGNVAELPQSTNVKVELNKVVELVHNLFRKREDMDITLSEPIDAIHVHADKNQLIRILNNLVKNATEAIPKDRVGKIQLSLYAKDDKAIIKVSDNGLGIPESMKEKIFQPKFTTKDSGSGLGLAIATNMMESMNGRLYFDSQEGQGTNFYIELDIIRHSNFNDQNKRITLD